MINVEETKSRLLQEAIQDNIMGARRKRSKFLQPHKRFFPTWVWVLVSIVSLAYLFTPSYVVSTGSAFREPASLVKQSAGTITEQPSPTLKIEPLEPEIPAAEPKPLNRAVFPLSVKKIVLDPGHGGEEPGAVSTSGVAEKDIALDIALRLRRLMEEASFEIMLTRNGDQTVPLSERAAIANAHGADIFVSIHVNWTDAPGIRPLETYYLGPPNDPISIQVASRENRESAYSLANFRRLLEKIYLDGRRSESRKLAKTVQRELFQSLSQINPLLEDRGVKTAPFAVLVGTEMPAILVEVSCLSNDDEVRLLTNPDYRQQIARSLFRAIRSYAHSLNGSNKKGS